MNKKYYSAGGCVYFRFKATYVSCHCGSDEPVYESVNVCVQTEETQANGVRSCVSHSGFYGLRLIQGAMRHHWLLLGACGWVLLILMFASKFISFRAIDGGLSF